MHVDLTTPDPSEPDEPTATTAPLPGPADAEPVPVEKEPARLTAREELLLPLRELGARVRAGSPVLTMMILRGLWQALRKAAGAAPAPAVMKPPKIDMTKGPVDSDDQDDEEKEQKPAPKATGRTGGPASAAEQFALGAVILAMALAALGSVGPVIARLVAPYAVGVVPGLIVAWCLTAAYWAPLTEDDDTTENDQEKGAGEEDQKTDTESDPWPAQRAAIRQFVEHEVTAGAAGHLDAKGRGATVDHLLEKMREKQPLEGWDRKRMTEFLGKAGITVRPQMKFRLEGKPVTPPGVHVEDLAEDLGKTPVMPPRLVPDNTPGAPPYLAIVPTPADPLDQARSHHPAAAPTAAPGEGRTEVG
jgi:hypothetical protein